MSGWKVAAYRARRRLFRPSAATIRSAPIDGIVRHVGFETQPDTERGASRLENLQQTLPADAAEAVARRSNRAAAEVDLDVVPVVEGVENLGGGLRIGRAQRRQRLIGEDDAPAERVVGTVALEDGHVVRGVVPLHQQREVQAGRSAADARDTHGAINFRP